MVTYENVYSQLVAFENVYTTSRPDAPDWFDAIKQESELIYQHIPFREWAMLWHYAEEEATLEKQAELIVAAAQGRNLTEVLKLSPLAEAAYNIKYYREKEQLTQLELANKVGITQSYVAKIEKGDADITISLFAKIREALNQPNLSI